MIANDESMNMTGSQNSHNAAFTKFWHRYLSDHARQGTRALHFIGSGIAICALVLGVVTLDPVIPVLGIALGYAFSLGPVIFWSNKIVQA